MTGKWRIRQRMKPGDIGSLTYLHGILYAKEYGYDQTFEAYVASGLAEFARAYDPEQDNIWLAEIEGRIIGSIAIVGRTRDDAQLRWFLVHPDYRGLGIGKKLLNDAIQFGRKRGYKILFLWTTSELITAGHLYTRFGFIKTEEKTHKIWGKKVTEERYDLTR